MDTSVCVGGRVRPLPVPVLPLTCLLMCLQLLYYKGIERGVLPYIKFGEILVYTISTSIVFHAVRPLFRRDSSLHHIDINCLSRGKTSFSERF